MPAAGSPAHSTPSMHQGPIQDMQPPPWAVEAVYIPPHFRSLIPRQARAAAKVHDGTMPTTMDVRSRRHACAERPPVQV